jgi:hypothetical protein
VLLTNNLLGKGWAKKQPFGKRLGQKTTFWEKVGPKNNLLGKGWAKNLLVTLQVNFILI